MPQNLASGGVRHVVCLVYKLDMLHIQLRLHASYRAMFS